MANHAVYGLELTNLELYVATGRLYYLQGRSASDETWQLSRTDL